ncbi:hypothetical protein OPT61_g3536 [Boeremia exigua]|uniref:Uncharacterized protein n=1 Tax=Boeremia exigua TaxID=749465 RepID=A0ACC2IHJ0_9PLEO|nr:hypothetical protein OPT61_g3536 [Boeremia exigua]
MLKQLGRILRPALMSRPNSVAATSRAVHVPVSAKMTEQKMNPHKYTNGCWLNNDRLNREARYVEFNFAALCGKAVSVCTGATKVVRYEKKEGGFNRVFILWLDNGAHVVARVPFRIAGPRRLTTNSEVATMAYIRSCTKIPVPKVLDWSDDESSIGTEYIIMEHADGVQLHNVWPSMTPHQHMLCVKNIGFITAEMAKLSFPVYGSLYFANAPIEPSLKCDFVEGFWTDLQSYCPGLTDTGYSRIPNVDDTATEALRYRGSVQDHLHLLESCNRVIEELARTSTIRDVAVPTLLHPDIHKRNIFVSGADPSQIIGIIDWQSTSIEPAFVYANHTPDLVEDPTVDISVLKDCYRARNEMRNLPCRRSILKKKQQEEIAEHKKQFEDFESVQQLKLFLKRVLDAESDGWVPVNQWAAMREENAKLFGEFLESVKESGGSEERARALWPFSEIDKLSINMKATAKENVHKDSIALRTATTGSQATIDVIKRQSKSMQVLDEFELDALIEEDRI